jgi:hypothetical protein
VGQFIEGNIVLIATEKSKCVMELSENKNMSISNVLIVLNSNLQILLNNWYSRKNSAEL